MALKFLLDTHVVVRWLAEPKKLSRNQTRRLEKASQRAEPVAISAITLLEVAVLAAERRLLTKLPAGEILAEIQAHPAFQVLPLTFDIATEVALIGGILRDPADRTSPPPREFTVCL